MVSLRELVRGAVVLALAVAPAFAAPPALAAGASLGYTFADGTDGLNVNLFLPQADVARDAPLVAVFAETARRVSRGGEEGP